MTLSAETQELLTKLLYNAKTVPLADTKNFTTAELSKAVVRGLEDKDNITGITATGDSPASLVKTVEELKEGYETLMRSRGDVQDSAVLVRDLTGAIATLYSFIANSSLPVIDVVNAQKQLKKEVEFANCAGTFILKLPSIVEADRPIVVTSTTGTITVQADATIQGSASVAVGVSREWYPSRGQWWLR